jgi:hypothetical protein
VLQFFQIFAEPDEPRFRVPRFDSFSQGSGWWHAALESALSTAAFFAVAGVILAIRGHLGLH